MSTAFVGREGATSLKAEIIASIPEILDASQYRNARRMLRDDLGGAEQIREELIFSGFVDPDTNMLTTNSKPFNVFAQLSKGVITQPGMQQEQDALGEYKSKYMVCCNRPENDIHWDSADPQWVTKASMSRKHRFLTTKDLHWQWFNALVFGMAPDEFGGVSIEEAVAELKKMKAAAIQYTKRSGGWSDRVGLFVNVFGHNSVNSLFIHILDMKHIGPPFDALSYKNCPLDLVLKVLEEECLAPVGRTLSHAGKTSICAKRRYFFAGTDGATSIKAEITGRIPVLKDAAGFREARRIVSEEMGGVQTLREELARAGWVNRATDMLTTETKPFNIFARCSAGVMIQPEMEAENKCLGELGKRFMICRNRPENDEHWDSEDKEWLGKQSMSMRHRFLTTRNLHWSWFNALTFGKVPKEEGGAALEEAIAELESMKAAALTFTANTPGWSNEVGLYFHVFGHNSVNSLHMHILDMSATGPTWVKYEYKNCPLDAILKVLKEEAKAKNIPTKTDDTAVAVAAAAVAAAEAAEAALQAVQEMKSFSRRASSQEVGGYHSEGVAKVPGGILELNVGGKITLSVARATLLIAPPESLFYKMFSDGWDSPPLTTDGNGRIFLDFPPTSFERMVDHLRLLRLAPVEKLMQPPKVPAIEMQEFTALASILGVEDFFLGRARNGRADSEIQVVDIDNPPCCYYC